MTVDGDRQMQRHADGYEYLAGTFLPKAAASNSPSPEFRAILGSPRRSERRFALLPSVDARARVRIAVPAQRSRSRGACRPAGRRRVRKAASGSRDGPGLGEEPEPDMAAGRRG